MAALLTGAAVSPAAPPRPKAPLARPEPAPAKSSPPEVRGTVLLHADALPTSVPAASDLLLSPEDDRRARALAFYAQGLLAEDNADSDAALDNFRKAFDLDTSNAELAIKLAYMLAQRHDAPGGIQVLKDAVKAAPKEPMPLIYLSQLYAKYLKKNEQALRYAEQALALDANLYPAYLAVYELQIATGQPGKATATLQQAAKGASTDPQYWLQIGELFARAYLRGSSDPSNKDIAQTNALFRKAATLGQDDALVLAKVGNFFTETKQASEAIPFYLSALKMGANSEDPILVGIGDKLARALNQSGQREDAIVLLERLAAENPSRVETFQLLGELYEEAENTERALASYRQALALDGTEARNHMRVTYMLLRQKLFPEAVAIARQARQQFPDDPQTIYLLAIALSEAKQSEEALAVYDEALTEFRHGHEELLNAQFFYSYGATAEQAGQLDRAAEMLKKSIELAPGTFAQAYNYLGYMWAKRGLHLDEAGELIRMALEIEPDNGAFLDSYGWMWYKKGDFEKALSHLLKAAQALKPEDPVVMEHLGDTYLAMGKVPQALQYWQKALAMDTGNKSVAEKIEAAKQKVSSSK